MIIYFVTVDKKSMYINTASIQQVSMKTLPNNNVELTIFQEELGPTTYDINQHWATQVHVALTAPIRI